MAARYLEMRGVRILERNFRSRQGEIDLIARHGEYLVFCEVKYRRNNDKGTPQDAVGYAKQRRICKVADYYRVLHGLGNSVSVRYDVIAIQDDQIEWIPNAFPHVYAKG